MKVGYYLADQNPHRDRTLGVTAYTDGLLQTLRDLGTLELVAVTSASSYIPPVGIVQERLPIRTDGVVARATVDNLHPYFTRAEVDLWHYPKGHLPVVGRFRKPLVGTVHDVILQHYADHYPRARSRLAYAYWLRVLKRSIARFDVILTVSEFSKRAINEFCERYEIKSPPIRVTYEGFVSPTDPPVALPSKQNKVLHLASVEPHKQTSSVLRLWQQLTTFRKHLPRLQLIGDLVPPDRDVAERISGTEICGRVTSERLRHEMGSARALLLPSEIEGFGLPALEAYTAGTPAVYVKGTAVDEILESAPGGFCLGDTDSLLAALDEALNMPMAEVAARSTRLKERFSWATSAAKTVQAYEEFR